MDKFIHSVQLDTEACRGCINCIKYCPTQAIRVQNGKARIKPQFCVDCGRCIRYCPHHAKIPVYDFGRRDPELQVYGGSSGSFPLFPV